MSTPPEPPPVPSLAVPDDRGRRLPKPILALAIAAFALGASEFTIIGLLPEVAGDLNVSIPSAGLLVSSYALGVVIGAPLMTAAGTRVRRDRMLLGLMAIFTIGNVLSAVAPSYGALVVSRVLAALPQGAFFGVAAVVASGLVAPAQRHRAVAATFAGLAASNVVGVPLGTLVGQELGWRATFWAIAALGILSLAAIARLVPPMAAGASLRRELAAFRRGRVWLALATIVLGFGGTFAIIGYLKPLLTNETGLSEAAVLPVLIVLGVGMVTGTRLVGSITRGRDVTRVVPVLLTAMVAVLLLFCVASRWAPTAILLVFLLGTVAFALTTPMQAMAMDAAADAPTLTSAAAQGAFNLGNALGPALGGLALDAGLGYPALGLVGAAITATGITLAVTFALRTPPAATTPDRSAPRRTLADPTIAITARTHGTSPGTREEAPPAQCEGRSTLAWRPAWRPRRRW